MKFNETKAALRDINKSLSDRARQQFTARGDQSTERRTPETIDQEKKESVVSKVSEIPDSQPPESPPQENRRGGI